jgi:tRNA A-37 threonylcarbamoyl transferase component Bud32
MLYQVRYNPKITKNIIKAFTEIHERRIYHGDVRVENILVRPDNSVVIIDFEMSEMDANQELLDAEMEEVSSLCTCLERSC